MKRLFALVSAFLLMLVCIVVPVSADSMFDTAKKIEPGKKYTAKINEGAKQHDYKIQVDGKGVMSVSLTSDIKWLTFKVYDSNGAEIYAEKEDIKTGRHSGSYDVDSNTGTFKGTMSYSVKKGTYYLHFQRYNWENGKFSFSVKTPGADGKATDASYLSINLKKGSKVNLGAVISGKNTDDVTLTTSDKKVAKVDSDGNVTAAASGTAIITVQSGKKSFQVAVVVK